MLVQSDAPPPCVLSKIDLQANLLNSYTVSNGFGTNSAAAVSAPDGRIWFVENGATTVQAIGTNGTLSPTYTVGANPQGITVGPDGNVWVAYAGGGVGILAKVTTGGAVTPYGNANGRPATAAASRIVTGADGNLWFTDYTNSAIGKFVY